jgi:hypothetical protein
MKGLDGIDEHAGNFPGAPSDDHQRGRMHVLEGETIVERPLAAEPGLHAVPPAVVGPGKAHDELPARIEARQPDGGHDRLGATHVEGHFVEP